MARGYPDLAAKEEEILQQGKRFMYPRPASEPSSPSASRSSTPAPSEHGDDEDDDIDEDEENAEMSSNPESDMPMFKWWVRRKSQVYSYMFCRDFCQFVGHWPILLISKVFCFIPQKSFIYM